MSLPDHLCYQEEEDYQCKKKIGVLFDKRMKYLEATLKQFNWTRWRQEYLSELCESHRTSNGTPHLPQVAVGDVVIVHTSEDLPRNFWRLG